MVPPQKNPLKQFGGQNPPRSLLSSLQLSTCCCWLRIGLALLTVVFVSYLLKLLRGTPLQTFISTGKLSINTFTDKHGLATFAYICVQQSRLHFSWRCLVVVFVLAFLVLFMHVAGCPRPKLFVHICPCFQQNTP